MKKIISLAALLIVMSSMFLCVNASAAIVTKAQIDGAISWARNVSFSTGCDGHSFSGYCLTFVQYAYSSQGVTVGSQGNAQTAAKNLMVREGDLNPPKGALVFFSNKEGTGHVGIALGDGTYIHAASNCIAITVLTEKNSSYGLTYLGWGYPGKNNVLATASSTTISASNTYTAYVTGTDGSLVINSKPSAGYSIGEIPEGGAVTVDSSGTSGNWLWVTYNGVSGYSYSKYLTTTAPSSSTSTSSSSSSSSISNYTADTVPLYLFDAEYYWAKYYDLQQAIGLDKAKLYEHWLSCGIKEGRSPSPVYDPGYYLSNNADLQKAFGTDYTQLYNHWVSCGVNEFRKSSAIYDGGYYKSKYSDLQNAFGSNSVDYLQHFFNFGMNEGRQASESFNVNIYKDRYEDLKNAIGDDMKGYYYHYMEYGISEGRSAT